jgi:hypothetical protein
MKKTIQVLLDYLHVYDGSIGSDIEVGSQLIFPIQVFKVKILHFPVKAAPEILESLGAERYRMTATLLEIREVAERNLKAAILKVNDLYFVWKNPPSNICEQGLTNEVKIHMEVGFMLDGWDLIPRRPIKKLINEEYPKGVWVYEKHFEAFEGHFPYLYQLYKVITIRRYQILDGNLNRKLTDEWVQKTGPREDSEFEPPDWDDFLLTLEYQGVNGLQAINEEIDRLGTDEYLDANKWHIMG